MPVLDCGDIIDGTATVSSLEAHDTVFNFVLRIITGAGYNTHNCTLDKSIGGS